jgi:hypothetical protein
VKRGELTLHFGQPLNLLSRTKLNPILKPDPLAPSLTKLVTGKKEIAEAGQWHKDPTIDATYDLNIG